MRELEHPNIVRYLDSFSEEEFGDVQAVLVMEFMHGGDLRQHMLQRVKDERHFEEEELCRMMKTISSALDYAHRRKIVHRDLKADNIFMTADGTPKIGDFGFARPLGSTTQATSVLGTIGFMAPEISAGRPYDKKSDLFALGCVFGEMMNGKPPFTGSLADLLGNIKRGQHSLETAFSKPVIYSHDLKELIERLLSVDPAKRPDMIEVMDVIKKRVPEDLDWVIEDVRRKQQIHKRDKDAQLLSDVFQVTLGEAKKLPKSPN